MDKSSERQMYQLHKKGYEDLTKVITNHQKEKQEVEVNVNLMIEITTKDVKDVKVTQYEEDKD